MKLLDRLKEWLGRRALVKEAQPDRKPVAKNLAMSVKVGIIYFVADETAHNQVRNYVKKIKEELGLTKIMALGYYDEKVMPHYLHAKLNFDVFSVKDLNWYRIPHGNVVQNFMAEEYDVLIDLTVHDLLPLQYILAKSRARFKVGRQSETNAHFLDMMIDTAGADSLPQLIATLDRYLMMVNAPRMANYN
ncbi:MAG TPA: hypothetical protein PLV70_10530 [Flavobacteriales bacterium]|nr:hypothetical protein [Flavobacteriales bacterium]HRO38624.1 hypothetical protein [Flavobacteriales bacterium]HRP82902.1 hypothetical protein [Flavobacteriales bacterium]HRQ85538.1 hypothetical protein [Flavobacteriales bacterium]